MKTSLKINRFCRHIMWRRFIQVTALVAALTIFSGIDCRVYGQPNEALKTLVTERFKWRQTDDAPIVLDNNLRRPFLFFRDAINQPWKIGRLFFIIIISASLAKLFAVNLVAGAQERCRKKFWASLACAFIYTTVLLSLARIAFPIEAMVPMALGCIALVQISYIIGIGLGVNIFANTLRDLISNQFGRKEKTPNGTSLSGWSGWIALIATSIILTAVSIIPEIGRLPRLGNRLVVLVAIIGLGSLISDMRTKSRHRESE